MNNIGRVRNFIRENQFIYGLLFPIILLRRLVMRAKLSPTEKYYDKFYEYTFDSVEEGSLVVRLPEFKGIFEIDFRSHILKRILRDKCYEPKLAGIVQKYLDPQKDVIDVGANIGLYSVLFSKLISKNNRVVAIEPTPRALNYLRRNIERNNCSSIVIIFEGVMTNNEGMVRLNTIPGIEEYSSLGTITGQVGKSVAIESIEVNGSTIDKLVLETNLKPGFIKIDTEGAEYSVISGAISTLKRYRPVIMSELSDIYLSTLGYAAEEVIILLQNNGYRVFNALTPDVPIKYPFVGEILAIPAEK